MQLLPMAQGSLGTQQVLQCERNSGQWDRGAVIRRTNVVSPTSECTHNDVSDPCALMVPKTLSCITDGHWEPPFGRGIATFRKWLLSGTCLGIWATLIVRLLVAGCVCVYSSVGWSPFRQTLLVYLFCFNLFLILDSLYFLFFVNRFQLSEATYKSNALN